jgi:hypothetical protein
MYLVVFGGDWHCRRNHTYTSKVTVLKVFTAWSASAVCSPTADEGRIGLDRRTGRLSGRDRAE